MISRRVMDKQFELLGALIYDYRFIVLFGMLLIVVLMVMQLPKTTMDMSTESFLHQDDPARVTYNRFKEEFGRDERVIVALRSDDLFSFEFLSQLRRLHNELQDNVPYLKDITSLFNVRNTHGEQDQLNVDDLLMVIPETEGDLAKVAELGFSNPFYRNLVISEDRHFTTIILEPYAYIPQQQSDDLFAGFDDAPSESVEQIPLSDREDYEIVSAVRNILKKCQQEGMEAYLAGSPVTNIAISHMMKKDLMSFLLLTLAIVALVLLLLFRRWVCVALPLITVVLSVLGTLGTMALLGIPVQITTQIMPSFLISVGVGASVHVLAIFFRYYDECRNKRQAMISTMGHSGFPILMTSLTTAAGVLSFVVSDVAPISNMGLVTAIGVVMALLFTLVLLNVLLAIVPIKPRVQRYESGTGIVDCILSGFAAFATRRARWVVAVGGLLLLASIGLATQIEFSHDRLLWLPKDAPARTATVLLDDRLKGTVNMELVIDTGEENGLYNNVVLQEIEQLSQEIEAIRGDGFSVGKVVSLTDIVKETNKALHENRDAFYQIPDNRELVAQELFLFENSGSDDLEDVIDSRFSKARVSIRVPSIDAVHYGALIEEVVEKTQRRLGEHATITVTGMMPLLAQTLTAGIYGAAHSYIIAFVVIALMMIVLIGNIRMGLLCMIPNITPVLLVLAIVVLADIPLGMFKLLVGTIAIGLAVDDTVHFVHNFRRYYEQTQNVDEAVRFTLLSTGRAMLATTIILSVGFFIFMFASMINIAEFGLLTGLAIIFALLADFLLAPAIMKLVVSKYPTLIQQRGKG